MLLKEEKHLTKLSLRLGAFLDAGESRTDLVERGAWRTWLLVFVQCSKPAFFAASVVLLFDIQMVVALFHCISSIAYNWNRWWAKLELVQGRGIIACMKESKQERGGVLVQDVAAAVSAALELGGGVTVVMRHADRPPLEKGDMTFGRELPLTEKGIRDAEALGARLSSFCNGRDIAFFYGESLRCRMTAECMARQIKGAMLANAPLPFLGGASPFLGNVEDRLALARAGNYIGALNEYFATGRQRGFNELRGATAAFAGALAAAQSARIGVFVTHDLNVACYAAGTGAQSSFTDESWPSFLSGIWSLPSGFSRETDNRGGRGASGMTPACCAAI